MFSSRHYLLDPSSSHVRHGATLSMTRWPLVSINSWSRRKSTIMQITAQLNNRTMSWHGHHASLLETPHGKRRNQTDTHTLASIGDKICKRQYEARHKALNTDRPLSPSSLLDFDPAFPLAMLLAGLLVAGCKG